MLIKAGRIWLTTWKTCSRISEKNIKLFLVKYLCGSKENVEMHHVRHLKDLNKKGKREMPLWMKIMISRKRKSIPLCRRCHDDIHHNRPESKRQGNRRAV